MQSVDLADDDGVTGIGSAGADRVPKVAHHNDFALGMKLRLHFALHADHGFLADQNLVSACAHGNVHEEDSERAEWKAHSKGSQFIDTHLRDGAIHEHERADRHHEDTAD